MATKKDLVEAYSFSRRRLVTAFVSGAPGGREVEPTRPGRAIVGGLALAVLLVAGGAVLGIIKSPSTVDLDQDGVLVSEKETGADYLVLKSEGSDETELRPLANITSAMLVLGADVTSEKVPRKDLNSRKIGPPIGILDAPATPPQQADLVQTGWTACTGVPNVPRVGIKVDVSASPRTRQTPDLAVVVRTGSGDLYLVAQSLIGARGDSERAYAYRIPKGPAQGRVVSNVSDLTIDQAVPVPDRWITLFPSGGDLTLKTFGLDADDLATRWRFRDKISNGAKAEVGDLLTVNGNVSLMTPKGVLELDDFSKALYESLQFPRKDRLARFRASQVPSGASIANAATLPDASWPQEVSDDRPTGQLCAQLDVTDAKPGVVLATTEPDTEASAVGVGFDDVDRSVDSGGGAFVQSGSWSGTGPTSPVLVDARGYAYPVGPGEETGKLGYGGVDRVVVPQDWLDLFQPGVPLTIDAARCPPTSSSDGSCS
ncbi:type VII secretion protein EccB [Nocardioides plantarum]|uniref:Type VII secretion protein EccB n=1 Tax=Nocardioides plantarum TaxID=29299 RepID=A0ABV5K4W4_9ACTN|nr:type VII secretion protein EccB [Nocardioides plantarum]